MPRLFAWRWSVRLLVALVATSMVVGGALTLNHSQTAARQGIQQRYAARAGLAANFVATYVSQLTAREKAVALSTLSGYDPEAGFAADSTAFGFQAAVLLDADGVALGVEPYSPDTIGKKLGGQYAHLAAALKGHVAVSNVVSSAALQLPAVAFAVPFDTPQGRRVFSGAFLVSDTPLSALLSDTTTVPGARLYLTDSLGKVIAENGPAGSAPTNIETLAQRDPDLHRAALGGSQGEYAFGSTPYEYVQSPVPGTTWTLLMAVPRSGLFITVNGSNRWLPWVILGCLSFLLGLAGWLALRLVDGRRRLATLNTQLAAVAQTDGLTGLSNRGHMTEQLAAWMVHGTRHEFPLSVLMIDIDHFKALNDSYGHRAGDIALHEVARRLQAALRQSDMIARWGGEEFLAVLPYSDLNASHIVAERVCARVSGSAIEVGVPDAPVQITVTISIGVALAQAETLETLVHRADLGLYLAKASGRDTVRAWQDSDAEPVVAVTTAT